MNMGQSIETVFRNYAEFAGRASRPEFWWFVLFSTLVSAALNSLNVFTPWGTVQTGSSLAAVWSLAVLVPTLAVAVRRLRDGGHTWAQLFWLLLPIAGLIVLIVQLSDAPTPTAPQRTELTVPGAVSE